MTTSLPATRLGRTDMLLTRVEGPVAALLRAAQVRGHQVRQTACGADPGGRSPVARAGSETQAGGDGHG
jgi:hypothetical protein